MGRRQDARDRDQGGAAAAAEPRQKASPPGSPKSAPVTARAACAVGSRAGTEGRVAPNAWSRPSAWTGSKSRSGRAPRRPRSAAARPMAETKAERRNARRGKRAGRGGERRAAGRTRRDGRGEERRRSGGEREAGRGAFAAATPRTGRARRRREPPRRRSSGEAAAGGSRVRTGRTTSAGSSAERKRVDTPVVSAPRSSRKTEETNPRGELSRPGTRPHFGSWGRTVRAARGEPPSPRPHPRRRRGRAPATAAAMPWRSPPASKPRSAARREFARRFGPERNALSAPRPGNDGRRALRASPFQNRGYACYDSQLSILPTQLRRRRRTNRGQAIPGAMQVLWCRVSSRWHVLTRGYHRGGRGRGGQVNEALPSAIWPLQSMPPQALAAALGRSV